MKTAFHILFSLHVLHEYFENGMCDCLVFKPNEKTAWCIKKYGFKMNESNNGFTFYSSQTDTTNYLNYIQNNTETNCFEFDIISTNLNFNAFTDIPTDVIGQFLFTSNQVTPATNALVFQNNYTTSTRMNTMGTLKIYFTDIITQTEKGIQNKYQIQFASRATQWRYYVINQSQLPLSQPEIVSKHNISFEEATTVTIDSGKKALLFSSGKNLMKMSEVVKYKFDLVDKSATSNQSGKILFRGLPNPNPKFLGIEMEEENKIVTSPMYVYI
ncbi:hypothetical protein [Flavobacterium sp. J27]|uniref:hypothetical protein n=1 Tax=Flavobacterium sp. J27 TaxID=2060419 RepID=UPI001031F7D9|nr:hypothetical protein [Flavobacterium sp. J27]